MLSTLVLLQVGLPIWVAVTLSSRLGRLSEPALRADLAVTTLDVRVFLAEELSSLACIAAIPSILAMLCIVGLWMFGNFDTRDGAGDWGILFVALHVVLQGIFGVTTLLDHTRRACAKGLRLNSLEAGLRAVGMPILLSMGLWIASAFTLVRMGMCGPYSTEDPFPATALLIGMVPILAYRLAGAWSRLADAYLVIEVAPS